jgi:ribosome-binding ATPase
MKIGFIGIELEEGKVKYQDEKLTALAQKDKTKKITPFFAEFIKDEITQTDVIVITKDNILDLLINDMEKIETRIKNLEEGAEKQLMQKCLEQLEQEKPLCNVDFTEAEHKILITLSSPSYKPVVLLNGDENANTIITLALEKSNQMFFYTSGVLESHAWIVDKGSDIVTCAGKIHTDLARGFIKGDIVSYEDYMNHHNFNDCKSKGVAKLVDRDYIVQPNELLEIRFNV